ncbi:MAG TPA: DUF1674 domain-containing protein [Candidatus Competibacteraceae bacterium]|nr:DUF1674 domain-containing protein [Candidatus Competibacteraceae bacterium]
MNKNDTQTTLPPQSSPTPAGSQPPQQPDKPKEYGGPKGPEPTRYGDWELGGRCICLLYTSPSPRDRTRSRMPSSA